MNWLRALGVAGASLAMVGFAACGGDDDDDEGGDDAGAPAAAASLKVAQDAKHGAILTNADGLTLYVFTQDSAGKSVCNDTCAQTWPPLVTTSAAAPEVDGASGDFSLVTREDGKKQIALNGRPLYTYAADKKAGDVSGEGVGGVWFVAKANGEAPAAAATPSSSSSTGDPYGY